MRKGFTLMELLIVIIIIGILAGLGLPQFLKMAEKAKASEAVNLLGAVRSAQLRYAMEHSGSYAADCGNLDINWTSLKHFAEPGCYNDADKVADIARGAGATYTLAVNEDGDVTCTGVDCGDAGY
ncbi:MAG: prepilin-type N-terminal cleavage/methylation domain-containing protein [Candidatus Omnitrophica bacterium]|nr:prepilin-type N-terminal cleavage/methylation domain-containing protein [Candidatus Omnitrophota bacterium]